MYFKLYGLKTHFNKYTCSNNSTNMTEKDVSVGIFLVLDLFLIDWLNRFCRCIFKRLFVGLG